MHALRPPARLQRPSTVRVALTATLAVALAGCEVGGGLLRSEVPEEPVAPRQSADAEAARLYLDSLEELQAAEPARQAELLEGARFSAENAPTTTNRLRYALLLASAGHGGADPVAARRHLSDLLARPELLLPAERALAAVFLTSAEERIVLEAENRRLQDEAVTRERERLLATNRRLQAEIEENARLRRALEDAQKKLEAVTQVERSITERAGPQPGKP